MVARWGIGVCLDQRYRRRRATPRRPRGTHLLRTPAAVAAVWGEQEDPYPTLNLVIPSQGKENNFKAVLENHSRPDERRRRRQSRALLAP